MPAFGFAAKLKLDLAHCSEKIYEQFPFKLFSCILVPLLVFLCDSAFRNFNKDIPTQPRHETLAQGFDYRVSCIAYAFRSILPALLASILFCSCARFLNFIKDPPVGVAFTYNIENVSLFAANLSCYAVLAVLVAIVMFFHGYFSLPSLHVSLSVCSESSIAPILPALSVSKFVMPNRSPRSLRSWLLARLPTFVLPTFRCSDSDTDLVRRWVCMHTMEPPQKLLPVAGDIITRAEHDQRTRYFLTLMAAMMLCTIVSTELLHALFIVLPPRLIDHQPLNDYQDRYGSQSYGVLFLLYYAFHNIVLFIVVDVAVSMNFISFHMGLAWEFWCVLVAWVFFVQIVMCVVWYSSRFIKTCGRHVPRLPHPSSKVVMSVLPGLGTENDLIRDFVLSGVCFVFAHCSGGAWNWFCYILGWLNLVVAWLPVFHCFFSGHAEFFREHRLAHIPIIEISEEQQIHRDAYVDLNEATEQEEEEKVFPRTVGDNECFGRCACCWQCWERMKKSLCSILLRTAISSTSVGKMVSSLGEDLAQMALGTVIVLLFGGSAFATILILICSMKLIALPLVRWLVLPLFIEKCADDDRIEYALAGFTVDDAFFDIRTVLAGRPGRTLLHQVASEGKPEAIQRLLNLRADPNILVARDHLEHLLFAGRHVGGKVTALHFAVLSGNAKAVEILLQGGAHVNRFDITGGGGGLNGSRRRQYGIGFCRVGSP